MRPVQFILTVLLIAIVVLYFGRLRSRLLDRVVVLAFAILGISMVVAPDWTNKAASLVGVGRGADLFIYLAILGFAFVLLLFYSKIRDIEASLTDIARAIAIERSVAPPRVDGSQTSPADRSEELPPDD
jgi:hypothetical protein